MSHVIALFPIPPRREFSRRTWTSIWLRKNWVSGIFANICGDTVSKWTIGQKKKPRIWIEACIVHVGAEIHDYQGEGAIWSRKCRSRKDCVGNLTSLNADNVNVCTRIPRTDARRLGPGQFCVCVLFSLPNPHWWTARLSKECFSLFFNFQLFKKCLDII